MEKIIIEYYIREVYGESREYVKNPGQAQIIQQLVRQKTINPTIRGLLRDLCPCIQFNQVIK